MTNIRACQDTLNRLGPKFRMKQTHSAFCPRIILVLVLGGMILSAWAGAEVRAQNRNVEEESRQLALQELEACVKNKEIDPPPPPRTKIDECRDILGIDKNGNTVPCHMVAGGSCEVQ